MFGKKTDHQVDQEIFVTYDSKAQSYGAPVFASNHHELIREVVNMFKDPAQQKNVLLTNAEDFSIFRVGSYDKKTGTLVAQKQEHVVNLHDLRALAQPQKQDLGIVPT